MPLDPPSYLAAQGWGGRGQPLNPKGKGIAKPIIIAQKKTLGGVGKDTEEAFEFWNHIYSVSASTISIKLHNDSDTEEDQPQSESSSAGLQRTATGLLSNRRPTSGTLAAEASSSKSPSPEPGPSRVDLLALAKREAAKRRLYEKFYIGPVVGQSQSDNAENNPQTRCTAPTPEPTTPVEEAEVEASLKVEDLTIDEVALKAEQKAAKAARKAARGLKKEKKKEEKAARRAGQQEKRQKRAEKVAKMQTSNLEAPESKDTPAKALPVVTPITTTSAARDVPASTPAATDSAISQKRKKKRKVADLEDASNPQDRTAPSTSREEVKPKKKRKSDSTAVTAVVPASSQPVKKKVTFAKTVRQVIVSRWLEQV